jgi:predicted metal-dependent enzyme (double-stranded beta helix superfamily)
MVQYLDKLYANLFQKDLKQQSINLSRLSQRIEALERELSDTESEEATQISKVRASIKELDDSIKSIPEDYINDLFETDS